MYPPNAKQFFAYLSKIVDDGINWLTEAASILIDSIDHHTDEEIHELAAIAGKTNFDLKAESDLNFSAEEMKARFFEAMLALEQHGAEPEILEFLRERMQI